MDHPRPAVELLDGQCSCCCIFLCVLVKDQPSVGSEGNGETPVFVVLSLEPSLLLCFYSVCRSTGDFCL